MAVFARCDFQDAGALTLLSAHTSCNSGTHTADATWSKVAASSGDVRITAAGRAQHTSSSTVVYVLSPSPADADYTVSATLYCATDTGQFWLVGRQTGTTTYYYAGFRKSLGRWEINKIVSGTNAQIGTTTALAALTVGQSYALQFDLVGSSLTLRVDGAIVCEATDSSITGAGKAGVRVAGSGAPSNESQGYQLETFSADDVPVGSGGSSGGGGGGGAVGSGGRTAATGRAASAARGVAAGRLTGTPTNDTTPPSFTTQPAAANVADTSAVITWATDEASTTVVDYGTSSSYGTTVTVAGRRTQHAVPLTGLTASLTHHYRVTTADASGNTTQTDDLTFATTATADTTAPALIGSVAATGITESGATITWTTDEPSSSRVNYGTTSGYGSSTTLDTALVTQHAVAITGLASNQLYHYRVRSADAASNEYVGTDQTFTTAAAADVTAPTITAGPTATPSSGGATIVWTTNEASDSQVEYGLTASYGSSSTLATALVTSHSVTLTGLSSSLEYHYRVKSRDAAGNLRTGTDATFTTTAPANDIVLGAVEIYPTYHSIGYRIPFAGDENANATMAVRFRRQSDAPDWRVGFDGWRGQNGTDRDFRGSVLNCESGTAYDLEFTVTDADGGSAVVLAQATTWADAIPAASSLTVTHYVDSTATTGDTTGDGSSGNPWRSILKAYRTAPSGSVIQVRPGYYSQMTDDLSNNTACKVPMTLVAQYPSCGDYDPAQEFTTPAVANAGNHSIVCGQVVIAPTGQPTTDPHGLYNSSAVGPWRNESLLATNGQTYQVWRLPASAGTSVLTKTVSQMSYHVTRDSAPQRILPWYTGGSVVASTPNMESPAAWMHLLKQNGWYRYGAYWNDQAGTPSNDPDVAGVKDVYLVWPGAPGTSPNDYWWEFSQVSRPALTLMGPTTRVSGLVIRNTEFGLTFGHTGTATADRPNQALLTDVVVDHCTFQNNVHGVRPAGRQCIDFPSRITVEHNRFEDSNLRAPGPDFTTSNFIIPWQVIKSQVRLSTAQSYSVSKMGWTQETTAVRPSGGVRQLVVRRNLFDGPFNALLIGSSESGFSRHGHAEIDFYENYAQNLNDDIVEPEFQCPNWRVWENRTRWHGPFFSMGPISWGPWYIWQNSIWQSGSIGSADFADPAMEAGRTGGLDRQYVSPNGAFLKGNSVQGGMPLGRLLIWNNTYYSDAASVGTVPETYHVGSVMLDQLAGALSNFHHTYWRNNVVMASKRVYHIWSQSASRHDSDYNAFGSLRPNGGGGVVIENVANGTYDATATSGSRTIAALRTYLLARAGLPSGYASEVHTNNFGGSDYNLVTGGAAMIDANLADPATGDLSLAVGSDFEEAGVAVPNFERPGIDFSGSAPNIGFEP